MMEEEKLNEEKMSVEEFIKKEKEKDNNIEYKKYKKTIILYFIVPMVFMLLMVFTLLAINQDQIMDSVMNDTELELTEVIDFGLIFTFQLVLNTLMLVILGLMNKVYLKEKLKDFKANFKTYLKNALIGFVIVFIVNVGLSTLMEVLGFGLPQNQVGINEGVNSTNIVISYLGITIFTPILEELVFRRSVIGILKYKTKLSLTKINLIQAIIFGAVHTGLGTDIIFLPIYAVMGYVFGSIYLKSNDNIYASSITHILNNAISFL